MFKFTIMAIFLALPANANLMLRYFYTCGSGSVDCGSFSVNYHGDFGMAGLIPPELDIGGGAKDSHIISSNVHGEVLGVVAGLDLYGVTYGVNGTLHCLFGCPDSQQSAVSINNNGIYLVNYFDWSILGSGGQATTLTLDPTLRNQLALEFGVPVNSLGPQAPGDANSDFFSYLGGIGTGLGLNDQNQVLFEFRTPSGSVRGVLSPSPIPEPSVLVLVTTLLFGCGVLARRKFAVQPHVVPR